MRFNAMGFKFTRHHSPEKMAAVIFIFSKEGGNKKATLSFIFIKLICLAELKRRLSLFVDAFTPAAVCKAKLFIQV